MFGAIEFKAIIDDDKAEGDFTLSHYMRRLFGEKGDAITAWRWLWRAAIAALLIWLPPHFNWFGLVQ
ncbi:hypothetical protein LCGC14_1771300 [marine sediment metagenome]|uniref:Uncharacterized protein n=1 Tax=marine sediment metagenome TaxID=412755 RepID=A0A0F9JXY0_9ZZZZ